MKKKLYFLAIIMCILGGFNLSNLNAQTTVTIGYDSNPDGGLEWCQVDYILYNYSISQMIYTKDELEAVGITSGSEITSIGFMPSFVGTEDADALNRKVEVYVVNTDLTSLSPTTIAVSDPNFVGTVSWSQGQWSNITFSTPFEYDGGNILVCINDITGIWKSPNHKYYSYSVSECRGIYAYNDNNSYVATSANAFTDGTNGYTMTSSSDRSDYYNPCISITFKSNSEPQPLSLTVSAAKESIYDNETVQLTATAKGGTKNYKYSWSPADGLDNATIANPTFTPTAAGNYTFTCTVSDGTETLTADVTVKVEEAPQEIVIGQTSGDYSVLPGHNYYNYSISQQIYTSDDLSDLGKGFKINSISFMPAIVNQSARNWSVYLINTTEEQFESQTSFIALSENDCLYTGDVNFELNKWATINFTTPFTYEGNNILVCVKDNKGSYSYGTNNQYYSIASNGKLLSVLNYNDDYPYNVSNVSNHINYETTGVRSAIKLEYEEVALPLSLSISPETATIYDNGNITLTATADGGTGSYTYTWANAEGLTANGNTATFTPSATGEFTFTCTVSDVETTATATATATVTVLEVAVPEAPEVWAEALLPYSIYVGWDAVDGATGYNIHYTDGTNEYNVNNLTGSYHILNNLEAGTEYFITMTATNEFGDSDASMELSVITLDADQQYRIMSVSTATGQYLNVLNNEDGNQGGKGGVNLADYAESNAQIFTIEKANDGKVYFHTADGYYINVFGGWAINASTTSNSSAASLGLEFTGFYENQSDDEDIHNGSAKFHIADNPYYKVENVSGTYYPFANGEANIAEEWVLEFVEAPELSLTITADKNSISLEEYVTLTASANGGTGNYTYTWADAEGLTANGNTATFTPSELGEFTFTCTVDDGETTVEASVTITVEDICTIKITMFDDYGDGWGGSSGYLEFTINDDENNKTKITFTEGKEKTETLNIATGAKVVVYCRLDSYGQEESGYKIEYLDGTVIYDKPIGSAKTETLDEFEACSGATPIQVSIAAIGDKIDDENNFCENTEISFNVQATGGSGEYTYLWSTTNGTEYPITCLNDPTSATPIFTPAETNWISGFNMYGRYYEYNCTVTDTDGNEKTNTIKLYVFKFIDLEPMSISADYVEGGTRVTIDFTSYDDFDQYITCTVSPSEKLDFENGDTWIYSDEGILQGVNVIVEEDTQFTLYVSSANGMGCPNNTTIDVRLNTPATTYVGDGDWNEDAKWNVYTKNEGVIEKQNAVPAAGSDVVIDGNVTIPEGYIADAGEVTVKSGSITIEDGGQFIHTNAGVTATVKKGIAGYGNKDEKTLWHTISSPIANSIATDDVTNLTTDTYDLYYYDEPTHYWINHEDTQNNNGFNALESGRGYLYANKADVTLYFTGVLNHDNVSFNLDYSSEYEGLQGINLIGNPYTHNIYKGEGSAIDNDNLAEGYYSLSKEGKWGAIKSNDTPIAPCQSILVKTVAEGELAISKTHAAPTPSRAIYPSITIGVANERYSDEAHVLFKDGIGLNKVAHMNEYIPMLSVINDDDLYAIATMSEETEEIALRFEAMTMGQYTIYAKPQDGKFKQMVLTDMMNGTKTDLLNGSYTFLATTNDNPNRFVMTLSAEADSNADFIYINNGEMIISNIEGQGVLHIYDIMGRPVSEYDVNGFARISTGTFANGVYIVRLTDGNGVKTQKLMINN